MTDARTDVRTRRARIVRALSATVAIALTLALLAPLALCTYIAAEGSRTIVNGDGVAHGCATPATRGWKYEPINYDIALDARLSRDNPDWLHACPHDGAGTAGEEVRASDGVRIAGWYIPSGDGDAPDAPTVVIVHGWATNKSDTLRYAAAVHDEYNTVLVDLRSAGRSSDAAMTIGVHEARDLKAMLDWLERTKHPRAIALLGDSGGAAASGKLARTDARVDALILDSPHARASFPFEVRVGEEAAKQLGWFAPPVAFCAWLVQLGVWLRVGAWPGDADPLDTVAVIGERSRGAHRADAAPSAHPAEVPHAIPLAILYGTDDRIDVPARNAEALFAAAKAAGVDVELHACEGAAHGQVVTTCPDEYRAWLLPFLARAFASARL